MGMYTAKHFTLEELVPPEIFTHWEQRQYLLWMLFDIEALQTLDLLRARYGPCTVNDWRWGGSFQFSGWRPWTCPEGAKLSQHKFGRAFDCKFQRVSAEEVREDVIRSQGDEAFAFIHRIEAFDGMGWFHFDTGNHRRAERGIQVVGRC